MESQLVHKTQMKFTAKPEILLLLYQNHDTIKNLAFIGFHISSAHLEAVQNLPWIHRDPFDRLLIAQARCDDLTLVTEDMYIPQYDVKSIWD